LARASLSGLAGSELHKSTPFEQGTAQALFLNWNPGKHAVGVPKAVVAQSPAFAPVHFTQALSEAYKP